MVLSMVPDNTRFGVISCHERWIFLELPSTSTPNSPSIAGSPVYDCDSTQPSLTATLFAIMIVIHDVAFDQLTKRWLSPLRQHRGQMRVYPRREGLRPVDVPYGAPSAAGGDWHKVCLCLFSKIR